MDGSNQFLAHVGLLFGFHSGINHQFNHSNGGESKQGKINQQMGGETESAREGERGGRGGEDTGRRERGKRERVERERRGKERVGEEERKRVCVKSYDIHASIIVSHVYMIYTN